MTELRFEDLANEACAWTGLKDFGEDTWQKGLNALIASLNHDIDLTPANAPFFKGFILTNLCNRLTVKDFFSTHPQISGEKIAAPIIITGLPRSATTLAQTLLALDPGARFLRNWESAQAICPPPRLMPPGPDPRISAYHGNMDAMMTAAPQLRAINGINFMAQGTAECQNLMAHEFIHFGIAAGSSLFSYGNFLSDSDFGPAYRSHRRLLRLLQWQLPNDHWVLKAPMHLFALDALLKTYPDARIVFTHRDPLSAMSSGVSMVENWTRFTTGTSDRKQIFSWWLKLWRTGLKRALTVRSRLASGQYYDLFSQDLVQTPGQSIKALYDHFNLVFSRGHENRITAWLRDNPRSSFGDHPHKLDSEETRAVEEAFGFYTGFLSGAGPIV